MRCRITLAYDGTDFEGWQAQLGVVRRGSEPRTVQGVVEAALSRLAGGQRVAVMGAGRTDTGVHAEGQVASFDLPRDLEPAALVRALNGLLAPDVRVWTAARVGPDFDARRSALSKLYRYVLDTGPVQAPTRRRTAGHVPWTLDPGPVAELAAFYRGRHDFASLGSSGGSTTSTVRTITRSDARFAGPTLVYEVEANGFLRKMVRSLVGGLLAVGRGAKAVPEMLEAFAAHDRRAWPAPAEARGLVLVRVDYPPETGW